MENATKALLIVAGVLMGVLILSLGVYLYYALSGYITSTQERMETNAREKFNTQFFKYMNVSESGDIIYNLTIQDVITAANLANQNNIQHGLTEADAGGNSYYVKVNAKINGQTMREHLETDIDDTSASLLSEAANYASDYGNYIYKCENVDISISTTTGRVYEITFE